MASLKQWTWTWTNFSRWWGKRKPGKLQSKGSQRVRYDCVHMKISFFTLSKYKIISYIKYALKVLSCNSDVLGTLRSVTKYRVWLNLLELLSEIRAGRLTAQGGFLGLKSIDICVWLLGYWTWFFDFWFFTYSLFFWPYHGLWDLSCLNRDQTQAPGSGSTVS